MTEADFLAEILAHPERDDVRLVFADWLDDQGESARAEFIRTQLELSWLRPWDPRYPALARREQELRPPPPNDLPAWVRDVTYRRGFVGGVVTTCQDFAPDEALWASHPADELVCHWADESLAENPRLRHIRRLHLGHATFDFARLLRSPHLGSLEALHVTTTSDQGCVRLADFFEWHEGVEHLHTLAVGGWRRCGQTGLSRLGGPDALPHLTSFAFLADLRRDELLELSRSPAVGRLVSLNLSRNTQVGNAGVQLLLAEALPVRLEELCLDHCRIGVQGAAALGQSEALAGLRVLSLNGNPLGDMGCHWLLHRAVFTGLRWLRLVSCQLGDESVTSILDSPVAAGLRRLVLNGNRIGDRGAAELAAWPLLEQLEELGLAGNPVDEDGTACAGLRRRLGGRLQV